MNIGYIHDSCQQDNFQTVLFLSLLWLGFTDLHTKELIPLSNLFLPFISLRSGTMIWNI